MIRMNQARAAKQTHVDRMSAPRRILCPVDFSEYSRVALEHALGLARWYRSEILALHVIPTAGVWWGIASSPVPVPEPSPVENREAVEERLREFTAAAREGAAVVIRTLVVVGDPVAEILRATADHGADLVVIASHGASGFERFAFGSVSEKVLRRSTVPVYVVPAPEEGVVAAEPLAFSTVLCPVDFGAASAHGLELGFELAHSAAGRLIVLHVLPSLPDDPRALMHFQMPEYVSFLELDAKERLKEWVPPAIRDYVRYEERISAGKPHLEIVRVAKEESASFIAMGTHGPDNTDRRAFGSTAIRVVRLASRPVLVTAG